MALQLNKLLHALDIIGRLVGTERRRTMHLRAGTHTYSNLGVAPAKRRRHTLEEKNVLLGRMRALAQAVVASAPSKVAATRAESQAQRLKHAIQSLREQDTPTSVHLFEEGSHGLQLVAPKPTSAMQPEQPMRALLAWESDDRDTDHPDANLADANRAFEQAQRAKTTFSKKYKISFKAQSSMISLRWSQAMLQL